jgi:hypothetical protein
MRCLEVQSKGEKSMNTKITAAQSTAVDEAMPVAAWICVQAPDDASDYMGACKRNDGLYGVPLVKQADALAVVAVRDAEIARLTAERMAQRGRGRSFAEIVRLTAERDALRKDAPGFTLATIDVLIERQHQIHGRLFSPKYDNGWSDRQLSRAAACYANPELLKIEGVDAWPWGRHVLRLHDHRDNCVRAAALLLAEIERLDRVQKGEGGV